jgi:tetratricopeptide (TPR) repeat protein
MRALLNSLGLTLWSSIAIILAVGLAVVGYRVSLSTRHASPTTIAEISTAGPSVSYLAVEPSLARLAPTLRGQKFSRAIEPEMKAAQAALQGGRWQEVLEDAEAAEHRQGITVFDTKTINHFKAYAHLQLHENSAALTDFERVLATGIVTPEENAFITKTLSTLQARPEADREDLRAQAEPREEETLPLAADSSGSRAGDLDVRLGELYFGFGDYQRAVSAIGRGLQKGSSHLDDAYVYLGLSEQKLDNLLEARRAFARLKDVPNVSPKIVRLWTLYADTLASQTATADSAPPSRVTMVTAPTVETGAPDREPAWAEGRQYRLVPQPMPTSLPRGKVLVTELFSYACPACNALQSHMRTLMQRLKRDPRLRAGLLSTRSLAYAPTRLCHGQDPWDRRQDTRCHV